MSASTHAAATPVSTTPLVHGAHSQNFTIETTVSRADMQRPVADIGELVFSRGRQNVVMGWCKVQRHKYDSLSAAEKCGIHKEFPYTLVRCNRDEATVVVLKNGYARPHLIERVGEYAQNYVPILQDLREQWLQKAYNPKTHTYGAGDQESTISRLFPDLASGPIRI